MLPLDIADRLETMLQQERDPTYHCTDYLNSCRSQGDDVPSPSFSGGKKPVDEVCRAKMIQWMYQLVDFFSISRESVWIAVSYLDRFVSSSNSRSRQALNDRNEYQLAAMTALYIAIKLHEPVVISTSLLSKTSREKYRKEEFEQMEVEMLVTLKWRMSAPTCLEYAQMFLSLLPPMQRGKSVAAILGFVRYRIEQSVKCYDLTRSMPSVVAIACILNACNIFACKLMGARGAT